MILDIFSALLALIVTACICLGADYRKAAFRGIIILTLLSLFSVWLHYVVWEDLL
jgi:hypothetical protein